MRARRERETKPTRRSREIAAAKALYESASEQGLASALVALAWMCERGVGGTVDYAKAVELLTEAAASGSASAKVNLAYHYRNGLGVERDPARALELYESAALQGFSEGYFGVAEMCELGECADGAQPDYRRALANYRQAESLGDPRASRRRVALEAALRNAFDAAVSIENAKTERVAFTVAPPRAREQDSSSRETDASEPSEDAAS